MPKKFFFDTEFTGLHQRTTLISIGAVNEDGDSFYAELNDYNQQQVDEWIHDHVILNLKFSKDSAPLMIGRNHEMRGNRDQVATALATWIRLTMDMGDTAEMWSDCLAYDWVLFCDLFGGAMNTPSCVSYIPLDICTMFHMSGIDPDCDREAFARVIYPDLVGGKHNALHDARAIKACYERLCKLYLVNIEKKAARKSREYMFMGTQARKD